jgi:hypothetical protein
MVVYDTLMEDVVYHVGYFLYVVAGRFYCVLTFHLYYSRLGGGARIEVSVIRLMWKIEINYGFL